MYSIGEERQVGTNGFTRRTMASFRENLLHLNADSNTPCRTAIRNETLLHLHGAARGKGDALKQAMRWLFLE